MSQFEGLADSQIWQLAIKAYDAEQLNDAYEAAKAVAGYGMGAALRTYRTIEAEWEAEHDLSGSGHINELNVNWQVSGRPPGDVEQLIVHALNETRAVFDFKSTEIGVKVVFLGENSNAPWTPGRWGYYTPKNGMGKICLPSYLLDRPQELHGALKHEYAHHMVHDRAEGRCTLYLNEAIATYAQGDYQRSIARPFSAKRWKWLSPSELNQAFNSYGKQGSEGVQAAYAQAYLIGQYLVDLKKSQSLGELLDAMSDNSTLRELWMSMKNQNHAEEALKQVFGFGEAELFERAFASLRPEQSLDK